MITQTTGWPVLDVRRRIACFMLSILSALISSSASATSAETGDAIEITYEITVRIDPVEHSIEGHSIITANGPDELGLVLGRRFGVLSAEVNGTSLGPAASLGKMRAWRVFKDKNNPRRIEVYWRGELTPLDTTLDHAQTLGRDEPTSGEAGTFLPDSSGWYPYIAGKLASYRVSIELPAGQRGIVPGRLVEESESEDGYRARFEFLSPTGGIDLMAGPYTVETRTMHGNGGKAIQLRTYFHPQIADLADGYLESVKGYIDFYESWIGEYPFTEFSVVSSPTPTGFGMPTLTYLGIEVLRLPFIRYTSLGHEVLHNWWGNGVYTDYAHGNWSEGLTTFMADYAYKERENPEAALDMRRGWLRDFAALSSGQDAPLNTFTSRTHGATQIVGYNKSAMIFLMLRDMLGRETFDRALQAFWREQRFHIASWADLQRAFETASGKDLSVFFDQWLNRSGAPVVRVAEAALVKSSSTAPGRHRITVVLEQAEPAYRLHVPVAVRNAGGEEFHTLDLEKTRQVFTLDVSARPLQVTLDPDLRLFRRLMPDEAPPILRQVMVDRTTATVLLPDENGDAHSAAKALAEKLQHRDPTLVSGTESLPAVPVLVIGLEEEVDAWLARHQLPERPEVVRGKSSAQAWTVSRPDGVTLAVVSARDIASLAALTRPLPHYGRQSYVIFNGAKVIGRGAWPTRAPMVKLD